MASQDPWPFLPPRSTESRLEHFDEPVYNIDSSTVLYRFVDALCGDAGASSLKKEIFIARLGGAMESIYHSDLDFIFGSIRFLSRAPSESYPYDPHADMLTSDQWDEVRIKDAWYRARIKDFFVACQLGCTPDGLRMAVQSACSCDCDIYEVWRYVDGLVSDPSSTGYLGRAPVTARNEVVVRPHKMTLEPREQRLLEDMLEKIAPVDAVITVNTLGLSMSIPITVRAISADSSYYQVEKEITPSPILASIPPPELLAIDLDPSQQYLFSNSPELAPYAAFNITQEYDYYYLTSGGSRSPIDSVTYGTLQPDGSIRPEPSLEAFDPIVQYGPWTAYERADSPDNYPGGKFGLTPAVEPALNPDGTPYVFAWPSQQAYVEDKKAEAVTLGGQADDLRYRLPIVVEQVASKTFRPEYAIAYTAPARDSTVTSAWTARKSRERQVSLELRWSSIFVRS